MPGANALPVRPGSRRACIVGWAHGYSRAETPWGITRALATGAGRGWTAASANVFSSGSWFTHEKRDEFGLTKRPTQVEILQLENALASARHRLGEMRKISYQED